MEALRELLSNQNWMIHDLVDGDQIDNEEEKRLQRVYEQAAAELDALTKAKEQAEAERDAALISIRDVNTIIEDAELYQKMTKTKRNSEIMRCFKHLVVAALKVE